MQRVRHSPNTATTMILSQAFCVYGLTQTPSNHRTNWKHMDGNISWRTFTKCLGFLCQLEIQDNAFQNRNNNFFSQKLEIWFNQNCTWIFMGWSLVKKNVLWIGHHRRTNLTKCILEKTFFNFSFLKPLNHMAAKLAWIFIGWSFIKCVYTFVCQSEIQEGCNHMAKF